MDERFYPVARCIEHMSEPDDRSLVEQAKFDVNAFGQLYNRYVDSIYHFVLRRTQDEQLSQDLTAATFEKALVAIDRFTWAGSGVRGWLFRIAHNELIAHRRKQRFWSLLSLNHASSINVEWIVEGNEAQQYLHLALNRLSVPDRELLMLRYFDELEAAEIAEVLGCSKDNCYLRLHRALKRLGKELEKLAWEPPEEGCYVWTKETI